MEGMSNKVYLRAGIYAHHYSPILTYSYLYPTMVLFDGLIKCTFFISKSDFGGSLVWSFSFSLKGGASEKLGTSLQ